MSKEAAIHHSLSSFPSAAQVEHSMKEVGLGGQSVQSLTHDERQRILAHLNSNGNIDEAYQSPSSPNGPILSTALYSEDAVLLNPTATIPKYGIVLKSARDGDDGTTDLIDEEDESEMSRQEAHILKLTRTLKDKQVIIAPGDGKAPYVTNETDVVLVDRALMPGDIVQDTSAQQSSKGSGVIIGMRQSASLQQISSGFEIKDVDTSRISYSTDVDVSDYVVIEGGWVGRAVGCAEQITVQFLDLSTCVVRYPDLLEIAGDVDNNSFLKTQRSVFVNGLKCTISQLVTEELINFLCFRLVAGLNVNCPPECLRDGRWTRGHFIPRKHKIGLVIDSQTILVTVQWLACFGSNPSGSPPPEKVPRASVRVLMGSWCSYSFQLGDKVVFKDEEDAKRTFPITHAQAATGLPSHQFTLNVTCTKTWADVLWQDGSVSTGIYSTNLLPVLSPDEYELWPCEIVVLKENQEKLGLVVSVNAIDRLANIRWYETVNSCMVLSSTVEELSLFELETPEHLDFTAGCIGLVVDEDTPEVNRLVEILRINRDGQVVVKYMLSNREGVLPPSSIFKIVEDDDDGDSESDDDDKSWVTEEDGDEVELDGRTIDQVEDSVIKVTNTLETMDISTPSSPLPKRGTISVPSQLPSWDLFASSESIPIDHKYYNSIQRNIPRALAKRILSEHSMLTKALPPGILVRSFEDQTDAFRCMIVGPEGTAYEGCLFFFDARFPLEYPSVPPDLFFHSYDGGLGKINPNLYENGRVCLSILGTWSGNATESWSPAKSLMQVLVSIQGLVLNPEPYFNEAGYDSHRNTPDGIRNSLLYNEKTLMLSYKFINHILRHPVAPFEEEIKSFYYGEGWLKIMVERGQRICVASETPVDTAAATEKSAPPHEIKTVSLGCVKLLKKEVALLDKMLLVQQDV
ncbi:hypothetical protein SmJEL517_g04651 [Synchytrium microbalum]|uniref:UBC core domain-containing protein n=1 Tax=Synchytrium microbalum TaxID=1806994 RepID=A0A507BXS6_9FUNG|nr:uncharacterized protein SmJEL517_g04651 [Synchytrium microbalum]TPX32232.1 hypothetical protein SmJEL517_g04651 [Synchytrium microbalum]